MKNGLQFVVVAVWTLLSLTCAAQDSLPSFQQPEPTAKQPAPKKPAAARGPLVTGAEQELKQARQMHNEALKRARATGSNKIKSAQLKYEVEMAELRLRQAKLSELEVPEEHKIVLRRDLNTALAKTKVKFANSEYETVKRLYARGSKTKQELKRATYSVKISKLELKSARINASDLPDDQKIKKLNELEVESAQIKLDLSRSEYELMKKLYEKSAVSKQRALYYQYLAKVARIDLVAAKLAASSLSTVEKNFKKSDLIHAKAKAKHKFLKSVHETNSKLYKRGGINKREYMKSLESLNKAEIELDAAREAAISDVET